MQLSRVKNLLLTTPDVASNVFEEHHSGWVSVKKAFVCDFCEETFEITAQRTFYLTTLCIIIVMLNVVLHNREEPTQGDEMEMCVAIILWNKFSSCGYLMWDGSYNEYNVFIL